MLRGFYEGIGTGSRCKEQAAPARVRCYQFFCRSEPIREEALAMICVSRCLGARREGGKSQ